MARLAWLPLVMLLALLGGVSAKVYEKCQLVAELKQSGVAQKDLADWTCLAYHESRYNTDATGRLNWDNSVDHGLFQISDIYWCDWSNKEPGRTYKNVCGKNCDAFHDDNISDDLACVMKIHKEHQRLQGNGFLAWVAWKQHCQGHDLSSYTTGCSGTHTTTTTTTTTRPPTPSVQEFYQKPSRTNGHTHFNNLAPLRNKLVRAGAVLDKER